MSNMSPLLIIGIVLLALWIILWLGFGIASWIIHLLLIAGLILLIWGLVERGRTSAGPPAA